MFTEPGTAREEAERLVAAALAFASLAAKGHPEVATGSPACCLCPFCKLIEAVRDPDPEVVERLATGAGDLAVGVAGLLRSLSGVASGMARSADPWAAATGNGTPGAADPAGGEPSGGAAADVAAPVKPVAKKAVAKKALKKPVPRIVPDSETQSHSPSAAETPSGNGAEPKPLAKKAVAKKPVEPTRPGPDPQADL